jgi:putative transposase
MDAPSKNIDWPHAPIHRLNTAGTYIVTVGAYRKEHFFHDSERLDCLTAALQRAASEHHWELQAWAIFSNHYHFVAESEDPKTLREMTMQANSLSARFVNNLDHRSGRTIWHQYWNTQITFPRSFFARLNYVHSNAVRHGVVPQAELYPWCSAGWFARNAPPAFRRAVMNFPWNEVKIPDEYDVAGI